MTYEEAAAALGINPPYPNGDELRLAYKKLAKTHHPDHRGDPEKFKQINEAYHWLCENRYIVTVGETAVAAPGAEEAARAERIRKYEEQQKAEEAALAERIRKYEENQRAEEAARAERIRQFVEKQRAEEAKQKAEESAAAERMREYAKEISAHIAEVRGAVKELGAEIPDLSERLKKTIDEANSSMGLNKKEKRKDYHSGDRLAEVLLSRDNVLSSNKVNSYLNLFAASRDPIKFNPIESLISDNLLESKKRMR